MASLSLGYWERLLFSAEHICSEVQSEIEEEAFIDLMGDEDAPMDQEASKPAPEAEEEMAFDLLPSPAEPPKQDTQTEQEEEEMLVADFLPLPLPPPPASSLPPPATAAPQSLPTAALNTSTPRLVSPPTADPRLSSGPNAGTSSSSPAPQPSCDSPSATPFLLRRPLAPTRECAIEIVSAVRLHAQKDSSLPPLDVRLITEACLALEKGLADPSPDPKLSRLAPDLFFLTALDTEQGKPLDSLFATLSRFVVFYDGLVKQGGDLTALDELLPPPSLPPPLSLSFCDLCLPLSQEQRGLVCAAVDDLRLEVDSRGLRDEKDSTFNRKFFEFVKALAGEEGVRHFIAVSIEVASRRLPTDEALRLFTQKILEFQCD